MRMCRRCGEPLKFDPEKGWVHMDGKVYKQKPDGTDDHCVLPNMMENCPLCGKEADMSGWGPEGPMLGCKSCDHTWYQSPEQKLEANS